MAALLSSSTGVWAHAPEKPVITPDRAKRAIGRSVGLIRPIAARNEVEIERMTFPEIRDALRTGKNTVIVPTGGIEHNGPYLVTAKHDIVIRATAAATARRLGDALVAPVVSFVPQGTLDPPTDGIPYAGTVGVSEETFRSLLRDIAASFKAQGFKQIVFIGDSGGNAAGMEAVAQELNERWRPAGVRVLHVPEHYDLEARRRWLRNRGIVEADEGYHDDLSYTAVLAAESPDHIRDRERIAANRFSINGVRLAPIEKTVTLGRELIADIATRTASAIRSALPSTTTGN